MQAIQRELSACVGCLDEGSSQIVLIQAKDNRLPQLAAAATEDSLADDSKKLAQFEDDFIPARLSHEDEVENIDEVFEAVMDARARCQAAGDEPRDGELFRRQQEEIELLRRQSESLMRELRCALVDKAKEHERRETAALQRFKLAGNGHGANKPSDLPLPSSLSNGELTSSSNSSSSVSSPSSDSDRKTVRSVSPDRRLSISSGSSGGGNSCKSSPKKCEDEEERSVDLVDLYRSLSISDVSSPKPAKKVGERFSASLLRSISSPDIKRALLAESSSPYVSLENLKNGRRQEASRDLSDSDSDAGSADELRYQVLKTYRRPLRPAALKAESKATPRTKRARNMTVALKSVPDNSYVAKHCDINNPLFLPSKPPSCFDSSIAAQAAARARASAANGNNAKEDVFGSDSD
jgi:hypothetical protein